MILTVQQTSQEYFRGAISKAKLYQLVREKQIPVIQISSRKIYFDTNELDKWIQSKSSYNTVEKTNEAEKNGIRELKP